MFCHEYLRTAFNGTQAAKNAGYASRSAHVEASRLLRNAKVQKRLTEILGDDVGITRSKVERIISELEKIVFTDLSDFISLKGLENEPDGYSFEISNLQSSSSCIEEVEFSQEGRVSSLKLYDKLKAAKLLLKFLHHSQQNSDDVSPLQDKPYKGLNDFYKNR